MPRVTAIILTAASALLIAQVPASAARPGSRTTDNHAATISATKSVTEGQRVTVVVKITAPSQATKVQLLRRSVDVLGSVSWDRIKTQQVNETRTHTFHFTATEQNVERTRATVVYRSGVRHVRTGTASTTVWRWVTLSSAFSPYYKTAGTDTQYFSYAIDGYEYPPGWMTYSTYPSWETRHTLGHHCKSFHGTLGLTDNSDDGTSATISFLTSADSTLYTSPALTPGTQTRVHLSLNRPYRFWIHADNTSPDGLNTYPAIGDPEFLCTGL